MLTRSITPTKNSNAVLYLLSNLGAADNTECDLGVLIFYQNRNILRAHLQVKSLAEELQKSKEKLQIQNAKLEYDVYHDSLTEMNNRQLFWSDLNKTIEIAEKITIL